MDTINSRQMDILQDEISGFKEEYKSIARAKNSKYERCVIKTKDQLYLRP